MTNDYVSVVAFANSKLAFASVFGSFFVDGTFNEFGQFEGLNVLLVLLYESFGFWVSEELSVVVLDDFIEIGDFLFNLILVREIM